MHMLDHIKQRRTVRGFTAQPIPQETQDAIFEAGMWAPSHGNTQPWDFVVIGPQTRAKLLALLQAKADELLADPDLPPPRRKGLESLRQDFGGAPLLVAVVSRPGGEPLEKAENPLSTAAAVQNMSLAAWDLGIGSVWLSMGAAPPARAVLGVAEGATVVAILAFGYPRETPPAPPREPVASHVKRLD